MFIEAEQNLSTISDLFTTASITESFSVPGLQQRKKLIGLFSPRKPDIKRLKTGFPEKGKSGKQFRDLAEESI